MKERNWSYLAGLFDGEGCIHIAKVDYHGKGTSHSEFGYRVDIHITMTYEPVVKWLVANFGGVYYANHWNPEHNKNWKPAYRWVPKGKANKLALITGILPYLIVKREIAKVALEFFQLTGVCPDKREALYQKGKLLTQRGKSVETNTLGPETEKIESDLTGDCESAPMVTLAA